MKKYIYLFLVIVTVISCKKDDDPETSKSNSKRPHITSYFKNGDLETKLEYIYNSDQISEIKDITPVIEGEMQLQYKYEFDYQLPVISINLNINYNADWTHFAKANYVINNSKVSRFDMYVAPDFVQIKESEVYTYENNLLILAESKNDLGNGLQTTEKRDYEYENQRLLKCNYYSHSNSDDWWVHRFQSYTYTTNHIEVSTIRQVDSLYWDKVINTFEDDRLIHSEFYGRNIYDELEFSREIFFLYDTDGNLIEQQTEEDNDIYITKFEYELGKDNLDLFRNPESQIYEFSSIFNFQFDKKNTTNFIIPGI